jgi:hypothetical protein
MQLAPGRLSSSAGRAAAVAGDDEIHSLIEQHKRASFLPFECWWSGITHLPLRLSAYYYRLTLVFLCW